MIYLVSVLGYKMSILILYLRLFAVNKTFRYLTWSSMLLVVGYLSANILTQIFGCSPRSKYWLPDTPGHCIDYTKAGLAYGSMNIVSDLLIFILPRPLVWRLKLSRREKAGVSVIFMSGAMYARPPSTSPYFTKTSPTEPALWQRCGMSTLFDKIKPMRNTLYGGLSIALQTLSTIQHGQANIRIAA